MIDWPEQLGLLATKDSMLPRLPVPSADPDIPRALFAAGVSVIDSTPCTGVLKQVPASYLALWEVAPMGCARSTNPCACYAQIRLILHETEYGAMCGKIAAKNGREQKKASLAP